jgi:hypothetical protein
VTADTIKKLEMLVSEAAWLAFAAFSGLRTISYIPQVERTAKGQNDASAISYPTWLLWTGANASTELLPHVRRTASSTLQTYRWWRTPADGVNWTWPNGGAFCRVVRRPLTRRVARLQHRPWPNSRSSPAHGWGGIRLSAFHAVFIGTAGEKQQRRAPRAVRREACSGRNRRLPEAPRRARKPLAVRHPEKALPDRRASEAAGSVDR